MVSLGKKVIPSSGLTVLGLYLNGTAILGTLIVAILMLISGVIMTVVGYTDLNNTTFYGLAHDENNYFTNGNDQNPLRIIGPVVMLLGAFTSLIMGIIYALACMADDYRRAGFVADKPAKQKGKPVVSVFRTDEHMSLKEDTQPVTASPVDAADSGKKSPSTSSEDSETSGKVKDEQYTSSTGSSSSKRTPSPPNFYTQYQPRPGEHLRSTGV